MIRQFLATISLHLHSAGGRANPLFDGYKGQFLFQGMTYDKDGRVNLQGKQSLSGGETCNVEVELLAPEAITLSPGQSFSLREGLREIGTGVVLSVIHDTPQT